MRWAMSILNMGLMAMLSSSCAGLLPPVRTEPLGAPPPSSALVVFVRQDRGRSVVGGDPIDVFDERGETLGRLAAHSWFAVERPLGRHLFVAGSTHDANCLSGGSTAVAALRVDLQPGQVYVARLARFEVPFDADHHMNFRCCYPSEEGSPNVRRLELIGVRPGGSEWLRAARILKNGRAFEAAPKGLRPFADLGDDLVELGKKRFQGGCIDSKRSRLESHHGADEPPRLTFEE